MLKEKAEPNHDVEFTSSSWWFKQTNRLSMLFTCPGLEPVELERVEEEGSLGACPSSSLHMHMHTHLHKLTSLHFSFSFFPPSPVPHPFLSFSLYYFLSQDVSLWVSFNFCPSFLSSSLPLSLPPSFLISTLPPKVPSSTAIPKPL